MRLCLYWSTKAKGKVDKTLFRVEDDVHILLVQIYQDDIIFGSCNPVLCEKFLALMKSKFEMSMICELNYFLGLQVKQLKKGIFINQAKYMTNRIKKFGMEGKLSVKGFYEYVNKDWVRSIWQECRSNYVYRNY